MTQDEGASVPSGQETPPHTAPPSEVDTTMFEGPNWTGDPAAYGPETIFHVPTTEQAAKGYTQNWNQYKTGPDVVKVPNPKSHHRSPCTAARSCMWVCAE